jgi:hypothetical protein
VNESEGVEELSQQIQGIEGGVLQGIESTYSMNLRANFKLVESTDARNRGAYFKELS